MKKALVLSILALVLALIVTAVACTSGDDPVDTSATVVTDATLTPTDATTEPETPTETPTEAVTDPETPTETPTDAVTDPETSTEAPTDAVTEPGTEPETETTPTSYTINWVVDGEIVATGTTANAKEEAGKPTTDPTLPTDGFTYTFAGWGDAVTEGTTVTYTAKFTAAWTPDTPIKGSGEVKAEDGTPYDGFAVELVSLDYTKCTAATIYLGHLSNPTLGDHVSKKVALYKEAGACISRPEMGTDAAAVAKATFAVAGAETKQFGDKTCYAVTLDLGTALAEHEGMLYYAMDSGVWFLIYEVVFEVEGALGELDTPDTDPVEPDTDPVEPETDPVEPTTTYTINWVVDGETVATATAEDSTDQSSKPADPTKATDGTFTYVFAGWSDAVTEGTTVTYTAKFNAKMNLTEAKPTGPISSQFTPVILGNLDLSQYSKVEMIVRFNATNHNGTTYYNRPVALTSSEAGVVRDKTGDNVATVKDLLAYEVVSADTYLDQKNFDGTDGDIDRHKFVIDLSDVTYNGDVYIASHGGQFWWLHEIVFYADEDGSWVEPETDPVEPETDPEPAGNYTWTPETPIKAGSAPSASADGSSVKVVEVDCSKYSSVTFYITHNSKDVLKDKSDNMAAGLFTAENVYVADATSRIAYNEAWKPSDNVSDKTFTVGTVQATACTITFDLTDVDYNGMLYFALQSGQWYRIHQVVFEVEGALGDIDTPDTDPAEPDTDPVEPETEPVENYTWIPETPIAASVANSNNTAGGFAVELQDLDYSKYSAITVYLAHKNNATLNSGVKKNIALYTEAGASIDHPTHAEASGAEKIVTAQFTSDTTDTKQFGDKTAYAVTIDLGTALAEHNGMLYYAMNGGEWFVICEVVFVAK